MDREFDTPGVGGFKIPGRVIEIWKGRQNTIGIGIKIPWKGIRISWKGGQNTMGRGFKIPWIVGSKYNG